MIAAAVAVGLLLFELLSFILRRSFPDPAHPVRQMRDSARIPGRIGFVLLALMAVLPVAPLSLRAAARLSDAMTVLLIVLIGWTVMLVVNHFTGRAMRPYQDQAEDNLTARKTLTQLRVLRQVAGILIFVVTASLVLLTFESVREYGATLFASAGVAGLVVGLAARPVLGNLFAGIQIALTQPMRINDVVIVEGEWGWIEEIASTYVVIRVWDWRRLVVPLSYFIEKPFQNWTRESTAVIGSVFWHVDYTAPVGEVRTRMEELVRASPLWDGQVVVLQVTDVRADTVELRGLMSAATSPRLWDLRCDVREKLLGWLQEEYPEALPRARASFRIAEERPAPPRHGPEPEGPPRRGSEEWMEPPDARRSAPPETGQD